MDENEPVGFRALLELIHRAGRAFRGGNESEARRLSELASAIEAEFPEAAALVEELYGSK